LVNLSLDSAIVVDVLSNHADVRRRFVAALERGDVLSISSLVLYELSCGAWRSGRPDARLRALEIFLRRVRVEPLMAEDALEAGRLRAYLADHGGPAGAYDELIAGQALARGWTMVTSNLRHFLRMPNLSVVDWRRAEEPVSPAEQAELNLELVKAKK
jgi:tRNA(fMet)-specific endonuclease VapC